MALTIIASSSLPPGIRGSMSMWLIEPMPGVFVGRCSTRVRDYLWKHLHDFITMEEEGYAVLIHEAQNEQGFTFQTAGTYRYEPLDLGGVLLVARQHETTPEGAEESLPDPPW